MEDSDGFLYWHLDPGDPVLSLMLKTCFPVPAVPRSHGVVLLLRVHPVSRLRGARRHHAEDSGAAEEATSSLKWPTRMRDYSDYSDTNE